MLNFQARLVGVKVVYKQACWIPRGFLGDILKLIPYEYVKYKSGYSNFAFGRSITPDGML
jgi:hypothetical protein